MELATHDLAALGAGGLIRVSATIPRAAPRTFAVLAACLVFPLSFALLVNSLFTHPILRRLRTSDYNTAGAVQWVALCAYQFLYAIFLFTFSLLSTAAAVFTVALLYTGKPASIASLKHSGNGDPDPNSPLVQIPLTESLIKGQAFLPSYTTRLSLLESAMYTVRGASRSEPSGASTTLLHSKRSVGGEPETRVADFTNSSGMGAMKRTMYPVKGLRTLTE